MALAHTHHIRPNTANMVVWETETVEEIAPEEAQALLDVNRASGDAAAETIVEIENGIVVAGTTELQDVVLTGRKEKRIKRRWNAPSRNDFTPNGQRYNLTDYGQTAEVQPL